MILYPPLNRRPASSTSAPTARQNTNRERAQLCWCASNKKVDQRVRHFRTRSLLVCIFQFAFVLTAITAAQNQYYVSTSGSDSNEGSQARPWATITHADAALTLGTNGTVVHVAPGTYNGNVTTNSNGTSTRRLVWLSDVRWGARIVGNGATAAVWINGSCQGASLPPTCGNFVDVNGFEITGSTATKAGLINYGSEDHFLNNLVHDVGQASCGQSNGVSGMTIGANYGGARNEWADGNVIFNIPAAPGADIPANCTDVVGLYFANPGGHAYNNIIYEVHQHGMQINHPSASGATVFSNNLVFNNGFGTGVCGDGIVIAAGGNNSINNNISYGNCGYGIRNYETTGNNFYKNNLLAANGAGSNQVFCRAGCPAGSVTGTLSGVSPGFVNYNGTPSAPSISGGIVTFPNADFHLQTTSGVDNAGTVLCSALIGNGNCTPSIDIDGNTRPPSALALGTYEPRRSLIEAPRGLVAIVK